MLITYLSMSVTLLSISVTRNETVMQNFQPSSKYINLKVCKNKDNGVNISV